VAGGGDVAVTPHEPATEAATQRYRLAGSAADAAIATNAVQGAVASEPAESEENFTRSSIARVTTDLSR
jgi:gamma-glutamyltranspeptidase